MEPGPLFHLNSTAWFPPLDYQSMSQIWRSSIPHRLDPAPVPVAARSTRSLPAQNELCHRPTAMRLLGRSRAPPHRQHSSKPSQSRQPCPQSGDATVSILLGGCGTAVPTPLPIPFEIHLATEPSPSAMDRGRNRVHGVPLRPTKVEREMESLDFRSLV
jgi:hypothetical protein